MSARTEMRPRSADTETLCRSIQRLRGGGDRPRDATIVVPVNAQADLANVRDVIAELGRYQGRHTFDVVLVVNNYPANKPPPEIESYTGAGARIVAVPSAWRSGEVISFTARVPGVRAAGTPAVICFDADVRIPHPTALLDWYVARLRAGATAAYTHVGYYELRALWSVRARIVTHHAARWAKRVLLRTPTLRGSNYAVLRDPFLRLYDEGLLTDDLNVGPTVKARCGRVAYSGSRDLVVLTSGRRFKGGWVKLARYLVYRLRYNLHVLRLDPTKPRERRNPFHRSQLR